MDACLLEDMKVIALHMKKIKSLQEKLIAEFKKESEALDRMFLDFENKLKGEV